MVKKKKLSKAKLVTEAAMGGFLGLAAYIYLLRPWHLRWGAAEADLARSWPGDELVPRPKIEATRAITIRAVPGQVWPWLAQMGQGRGGFYSYDWLENLVGCDIHNADMILPQFQQPQVGQLVRLGPEGYPYYKIAELEPERFLLLYNGVNTETGQEFDPDQPRPPAYNAASWLFFLAEPQAGHTRLIVRSRIDYQPETLPNILIWRVVTEPAHFVMERKMMLGIKQRAEKHRSKGAAPGKATISGV